MGSGTTVKVALDLKRKVIGLDKGDEAMKVVRARLDAADHDYSEYQLQAPLAKAVIVKKPVVERAS